MNSTFTFVANLIQAINNKNNLNNNNKNSNREQKRTRNKSVSTNNILLTTKLISDDLILTTSRKSSSTTTTTSSTSISLASLISDNADNSYEIESDKLESSTITVALSSSMKITLNNELFLVWCLLFIFFLF